MLSTRAAVSIHVRNLNGRRWLSSTSKSSTNKASTTIGMGAQAEKEKNAIPAQLVYFVVLLVPTLAFTGYFFAGQEERDKQLQAVLRERYPDQQDAQSLQRKQAMRQFYKNTILNPESGAEDNRLRQVLYGGSGDMKRQLAVDERLYGTKEGVEEKKRMEEELRQEKLERKKRRKRQKQKLKDEPPPPHPPPPPAEPWLTPEEKKQVTILAVVGTLAAGVGFLLGGSRRN